LLISTLPPTAAVMLNFEISLVFNAYMEEGATLSRTLLPYLVQVTDYRFLTEDCHFIATRFLNTLATHIKDTESTLGVGFIHFALLLNAKVLQPLFFTQQSI